MKTTSQITLRALSDASIYYGFSTANRDGQAAWFHSSEAAERFNAACGGDLGEIETTTEPQPSDVMDTPETPWTRE